MNISHMLVTWNFLPEYYDSLLFIDLLLLDRSCQGPCSFACWVSIQVFREPYCYHCLSFQFLCLLLHVCEPVGVSICHNHDCERMWKTWVHWSPFHSGVRPWWPLVVSSFNNGRGLAASLSRLCRMFSVRAAPSGQLQVLVLIFGFL